MRHRRRGKTDGDGTPFAVITPLREENRQAPMRSYRTDKAALFSECRLSIPVKRRESTGAESAWLRHDGGADAHCGVCMKDSCNLRSEPSSRATKAVSAPVANKVERGTDRGSEERSVWPMSG